MNKELPIELILRHLQARREALLAERRELQKQMHHIDGAMNETLIIETQLKSGLIPVPRMNCE